MKRISLLVSVLALVSFLSIYGCGDSDEASDEARVENCSGSVLCVGVLTVDESLESSFTQGLVLAAEKAKDDINEAGGSIELRTVEEGDCTEPYDTPSERAGQLIDAGVHAIVGHICSGVSDHILDNVQGSQGIIMISPTNTSTVFSSSEDKYKNYFRTAPSDVGQAGVLADLLDTNLSSTYVIYRNDKYGETFYEELERNGVVTATDAMPYVPPDDPATGDYSAIVDFLSGKGNDQTEANIILIAFGEGEHILKALLNSEKINGGNKYYFTDSMYGLLYGLKNELDDLGTSDLVDDSMQTRDPDPEKLAELFHTNSAGFYTTFVAEYAYSPREGDHYPLTEAQDMFRADYPHPFNAHTYDAVVLLALASLKAASTEPADLAGELVNVSRKTSFEEGCISYKDCVASHADTDDGNDIDYDGLSGPIEFDGNGDVTKSAYGVFSYEGRETNKGEVRNAAIQ